MPLATEEPRSSRLAPVLVTASVALAGNERIDLFKGTGPFALTPFLALSPFLVIAACWMWNAHTGYTTKRATTGLALLGALCLLVMQSVVGTGAGKSLGRALSFVLLAAAGWATIVIARRGDHYRALRVGAALGLVLYAVFDVLQWHTYQHYGTFGPAFEGFFNMKVTPYGYGVVRLSGAANDPNLGAVGAAIYAYILLCDPVVAKVSGLLWPVTVFVSAAIMVLFTYSRSGAAVFIVVMIQAIPLLWKRLTPNKKSLAAATVCLGGFWAVRSAGLAQLLGVHVFQARLNFTDDGSTTSHFLLITRAFDAINSSARTLVLGSGYGTSYTKLQDIFPGNEYGNYHTLYLTLWVECGVLALITALALLVAPLRSRRRWLALGALIFGVFYQDLADPIFWIQIGLLWALPDTVGAARLLTRDPVSLPVNLTSSGPVGARGSLPLSGEPGHLRPRTRR